MLKLILIETPLGDLIRMAFTSIGPLREYLNAYMDVLREFLDDNLISVYIFGSVARGDFSENSDIDLIVVVKGLDEDIGRRLELASRIKTVFRRRTTSMRRLLREKGYPTTISEVLLTPEEVEKHPPILLDLTIDGAPLIDRGGFMANELEKLKERLKELGAIRVRSKHGWYWILKPGAKLGEVIKV